MNPIIVCWSGRSSDDDYPFVSQVGTRKLEIDLTTVSSNYHVEFSPSDAGFQDRYVVQEIIKEMAKNRPMDVSGIKSFKGELVCKFQCYSFCVHTFFFLCRLWRDFVYTHFFFLCRLWRLASACKRKVQDQFRHSIAYSSPVYFLLVLMRAEKEEEKPKPFKRIHFFCRCRKSLYVIIEYDSRSLSS